MERRWYLRVRNAGPSRWECCAFICSCGQHSQMRVASTAPSRIRTAHEAAIFVSHRFDGTGHPTSVGSVTAPGGNVLTTMGTWIHDISSTSPGQLRSRSGCTWHGCGVWRTHPVIWGSLRVQYMLVECTLGIIVRVDGGGSCKVNQIARWSASRSSPIVAKSNRLQRTIRLFGQSAEAII
jgi:hypothetical protein